ncbi:hypothetical protein QBC40DRAFT_249302 [Triangularia verruculosa]|uniref:Uncharacterized protein n=1 Tax=Triangularia verruculosa TaxID=2587418 RepID=A0AAN7B025_9PEZI|nr:hypothetical protein QBC40DRAFT_249302 [Triangularia verruculosa]
MLEPIHTTRRSASHGALNRSYSSTSDPLHRPRRVHSRQQLRSVNENSSLLAFPGPLESMLKTTTETGDIGLFSIRPVRSSGNFHAPPSRRRPGHGETPLSRRPNGDGMRTYSLRDDRRWLPSYRDTTSEIIYMYGSDSLRSASSAFTPPYNDMGNRSYSMTTCSSRRPPSQKPSGDTLNSQHEGYLQRPRSPFPYPTRLKRPGVRPASPALTENGAVDYSKMVGIDRVSRRTVHGSYKPTYPQYGPRQMPRLRADGTSSSESFPNYGAADKYSLHNGISPLSPGPWGHRYRGRLGSSASEHSLRTSSLTSILNMYQRSTCGPPTRNPSLRVQPPGTFYYDYSEAFDYTTDTPPPMPDFPSDVATRSTSLNQSRITGDECESVSQELDKYHRSPSGPRLHAEDKLPSPRPYSQDPQGFTPQHERQNARDTLRQMSSKEPSSADLSKDNSPRFNSNPSPFPFKAGVDSQGSSGDELLTNSRSAGMTSSPRYDDEEWSIGTAVVPRRQNASLTVRSHLQFSTPRSARVVTSRSYEENMRRLAASPPKPSPLSGNTHHSLPAHYRQRGAVSSSLRVKTRRNTAYPINLGYSELASTGVSLGGNTSTDTQDGFAASEDSLDQQRTVFSSLPEQIQDKNMAAKSRYANHPALDAEGYFFGHPAVNDANSRSHKRSFAVPTINTNELHNLADSDVDSIVDRSRTPMLAPHPISPARQLRLQNSVPQLMKSLPPLPGVSVRSDSCIANFSSQDLEYIMGIPTPGPSCFGDEQTTMDGLVFSRDLNQQQPRLGTPSSPVVKSPLACSTGADERGNNGAHGDQREQPRRSGSRNSSRNSKLKLKVSRGALNKMHAEGIGGRRNTVAGPMREWSGPGPLTPRGQPSMSHSKTGPTNMDSLVESVGETEKTDICDGEVAFIDSAFTSTPAPAIPDRHQDHHGDKCSPPTHESSEVTSPTARSEARSSLSQDGCVSGKSPRGLKKRFSDLRVRLAESRLRSAETLALGGRIGEVIEVVNIPPVEAPMTESGDGSRVDLTRKDGDGDNNSSDYGAGKHQSRGFRGKMSRWFKAARQVVMGACSGSGKRG